MRTNKKYFSRLLFWYEWKAEAKILSIVFGVMTVSLAALFVSEYFSLNDQAIRSKGSEITEYGSQLLQYVADEVAISAESLDTLALTSQIITLDEVSNQAHQSFSPEQISQMDQARKDKDKCYQARLSRAARQARQ